MNPGEQRSVVEDCLQCHPVNPLSLTKQIKEIPCPHIVSYPRGVCSELSEYLDEQKDGQYSNGDEIYGLKYKFCLQLFRLDFICHYLMKLLRDENDRVIISFAIAFSFSRSAFVLKNF